MAEYEEDQIEFSILSLVKDPLLELVGKMAVNIKCLEVLNQRLATQDPTEDDSELAMANPFLEDTILGPEQSYDLDRERIDQAMIPVELEKTFQSCSMEKIVEYQQKLCNEQHELRAAIRDEQQSQRADDDYAAGRRYDYGPAIRTWVRILARKGMIESLMPVGL
jgi:ubiquitin carboxyl-terminal hydrolase L5